MQFINDELGLKDFLTNNYPPQKDCANVTPDDLVDCVREVAKGKLWFPNDLVGAAREHETGRQADSKYSIGALTPRERQIALLVSEGLTDKLVAEQLNLAEGTVKSHLHHIYRKLGIPNRTALSALAITHHDLLKSAEYIQDLDRARATKLN